MTILRSCLVTLIGVSTCHTSVFAQETDQTNNASKSGLQTGEAVPFFYSRVVTGPLMNRSVCFVCRNGNRPVVMLLMRNLKPELVPLMKSIDKLVNGNRAVGLRSFGVMIADEPFNAVSTVQTFAFNSKIKLPLTVATDAIANASCQRLHDDAQLTVLLYRNRKVVNNFTFRMSPTKDDVGKIQAAIRQLLDKS